MLTSATLAFCFMFSGQEALKLGCNPPARPESSPVSSISLSSGFYTFFFDDQQYKVAFARILKALILRYHYHHMSASSSCLCCVLTRGLTQTSSGAMMWRKGQTLLFGTLFTTSVKWPAREDSRWSWEQDASLAVGSGCRCVAALPLPGRGPPDTLAP